MQSGAGAADLAGAQRQGDQTAGIVGAVNMLRNAHAPKDDGGFGSGVKARHLFDGFGGNAADIRHFLGREAGGSGLQVFEAFGVGLHVLIVTQVFGDDGVQHGVQQGNVGARLELQNVTGVGGQPLGLPARVHDDELGAALGRAFQVGGGNRMIFGRAGADDDDAVGVLRGLERGADGARIQPLHQRRNR